MEQLFQLPLKKPLTHFFCLLEAHVVPICTTLRFFGVYNSIASCLWNLLLHHCHHENHPVDLCDQIGGDNLRLELT